MSGAYAHGDDVTLSSHVVESEGCFGAVAWTVCNELYAILPRDKRDQLFEGASTRAIIPYFTGLVERLLKQAGSGGITIDTLNTDWSFQTRHVACVFGQVYWQVGQGVWNSLPEDQREELCGIADKLIHDFFGGEVYMPLLTYAYRQMHG